jgi:hypothetical protein
MSALPAAGDIRWRDGKVSFVQKRDNSMPRPQRPAAYEPQRQPSDANSARSESGDLSHQATAWRLSPIVAPGRTRVLGVSSRGRRLAHK